MGVQGLEQKCLLRWYEHTPQASAVRGIEDTSAHVEARAVEGEHWLMRRGVRRQCIAEALNNFLTKRCVVPSASPSKQMHVGGQTSAQRCQSASRYGAFVADEKLRDNGLDAWIITHNRHEREVHASHC